MGRNQQMMRLDHENTHDINDEESKALLDNFYAYVEKEQPSLIILEDYNKGVLTPQSSKRLLLIVIKKEFQQQWIQSKRIS